GPVGERLKALPDGGATGGVVPEVLGGHLVNYRIVAILVIVERKEGSSGEERYSHRAEVAAVGRDVELQRRDLRLGAGIALHPDRARALPVLLERESRRQAHGTHAGEGGHSLGELRVEARHRRVAGVARLRG